MAVKNFVRKHELNRFTNYIKVYYILLIITPTDSRTKSVSQSLIYSVVNGVPTRVRPFFAVVKFLEGERGFCGATIVDMWWVVTAAHCLTAERQNLYILFGHFRNDCGNCKMKMRFVSKIITHQKFWASGGEYRNDIALLKMDKMLNLNYVATDSSRVLPLCNQPLDLLQPGRPTLKFCGLGSISTTNSSRLPYVPHEAAVLESAFASVSPFGEVEFCSKG
ncbi:serine protease 55-like isoform X2 [Convolutriloba macropyga]|uniref:serine protease 55-like isoform X2 n=1 Tax=Convolutriloba macropyga TaxID=536237 RepID=UPI003F51F95F